MSENQRGEVMKVWIDAQSGYWGIVTDDQPIIFELAESDYKAFVGMPRSDRVKYAIAKEEQE